MLRVGVQFVDPAERVKDTWERVRFPERLTTWEDADAVLNEVIACHSKMLQAGHFTDDPLSQQRELSDLRRKVPRGTPMGQFFAHRDYAPTDLCAVGPDGPTVHEWT